MMQVTADEQSFIRHALGLKDSGRSIGYRNRYFASGRSVQVGLDLVEKGMAVHEPPSKEQRNHFFAITTAGFEAARRRHDHLDHEEQEHMTRLDQRAERGERQK